MSSGFYLMESIVPNRVQYHMKNIILFRLSMPQKMLLHLSHPHLHQKISFSGIERSMFFKFGISFSKTNTANDSQFRTSKNGGTKLSDIITGTHS
ncbi:LOW QUALITY PROTEIN: uncharacterized protein [Pyrus communis]|uniref:LOW QUALITY PROTEIN: uncharacterized protein n=1 Tax=Pyrus communis TaxID=23211 RepID=UPI0035BEF6F8